MMSVRILGPASPARFALEGALTIEGIGRAGVDALPSAITVAISGVSGELPETRIYFGDAPSTIARRFGVKRMSRCDQSVVRFTCQKPVWNENDLDILDLASRKACVPCVSHLIVELAANSTAEILLADYEGNPLVLRVGEVIWSVLDLPASLAVLLSEGYLPESGGGAREWLSTWRPLQQLYYRAPRQLRGRVQRGVMQALVRKLEQWPEDRFRTAYPIDATGWLLVRAIVNLIYIGQRSPPSIDPWPMGFRACVVVTHDIEPSRYSYRKGLPRLLGWLQSSRRPPHTINPVAFEARRYPGLWKHPEINRNEVGCHGWLHDGRKTRLPREQMVERILRAKTTIESLVGNRVTSFRSPRLDRNDKLYDALDICGFTCDSTIPDVDRENTDRWGGGCALNFPFHPVVRDGASWRLLRLLECPVTAPDCAMPVFSGCTESEAMLLYARKLDWVEAIGGCYVAIFHGGVFDRKDAELRERLLEGYYYLLAGRSFWRATLGELERWWRGRESLCAQVVSGAPVLVNEGTAQSPAVVLRWQGYSWAAPSLAPGATWSPGPAAMRLFRTSLLRSASCSERGGQERSKNESRGQRRLS